MASESTETSSTNNGSATSIANARNIQTHPEYFYEDGNLFITAPSTLDNGKWVLFCIHKGFLAQKSEFFSDMFRLPGRNEEGVVMDGSTKDMPLEFPDTSAEELGHLFDKMFGYWKQGPYETQMLIDILKLSTIYLIPDLRHWSILHLDEASIPHALRYNLAIKYCVSSWFDRALVSLIHTPLVRLTHLDIQLIGYDVFVLLAKVRERITYERKLIAAKSPTLTHATSCTSPEKCKQVWSEAWWNQVAQKILHFDPDKEMSLEQVKDLVPSLKLQGMTPECRAGVHALLDSGLGRELRLVTSAVLSQRICVQANEWAP